MSATGNIFERAYQNIQGFGYNWANVGLNYGKNALETSAKKLQAGAEYLQGLTTKLNKTKECQETPCAESTTSEQN